ncbi:MAG: hypothetical protein LBT50_00050 [Prevotellaceae bacterium]|jgi:hypothetical protein|nr:hypothetical protein [Prevotellaceae bacterium]
MKQKIFDALKAKFVGVSDAVLNRIAEKLAKTVTAEEGIQTAVDGVTFQQIIDGEADRRATEATQTAVTNYEKKHGIKDGQKVQAGGGTDDDLNKQTPEGGDKITTATIAAAVAAAIKPLSDEITALKTGKVSGERKQKLDAIIVKLPDNLKKPYGRISVKDMTEDEFNTFIAETTTEVDGLVADFAAKGSVLKAPMGGGSSKKEPSKEEAAEILNGLI